MKSRVMYIERKAGELTGDAGIGRVTYSQTGKTLYYRGRSFQSLKGSGFKSNYFCVETGEDYWISDRRRDGRDRLYVGGPDVHIYEGVREEYWTLIRRQPEKKSAAVATPVKAWRCAGAQMVFSDADPTRIAVLSLVDADARQHGSRQLARVLAAHYPQAVLRMPQLLRLDRGGDALAAEGWTREPLHQLLLRRPLLRSDGGQSTA